MKNRSVSVFICLILLLSACSPATDPPPSATQIPTNTPTVSPAPTDTPTPSPTITPTTTPNATATQAAKSTQQMEEAAAKVKKDLEAMGIPVDSGSLAYYQEGKTKIEMTGYHRWEVKLLDPPISAADFVFKTDIIWRGTALVWCGLVFRSDQKFIKDQQGNQYEIYIVRMPGFRPWDLTVFRNGQPSTRLKRNSWSKDIDLTNGATNQVVIAAVGDEFTVYINGIRQGRVVDSSGLASEGFLGYIAGQDTGESTCTYENTAVWIYK